MATHRRRRLIALPMIAALAAALALGSPVVPSADAQRIPITAHPCQFKISTTYLVVAGKRAPVSKNVTVRCKTSRQYRAVSPCKSSGSGLGGWKRNYAPSTARCWFDTYSYYYAEVR